MKKITLFVGLFLCVTLLYSQSTRLVLHEEFTQSNCGPCASANPTFHTWLTAHPDVFTEIFYHVWWPSPNNDPMYLQNTVDNGARTGLYGVNAVPHAVVDGNVFSGNGGSLQWSTIQNRQAVPSPFEMNLKQELNAANDTIFLTMVAKATMNVTGLMAAHNVVIEKHIHFNSAPGYNGEKDFYMVMKKMLPTNAGTLLPSSMSNGDYMIIETAWKLANVYDMSQLAAVGFIQNKTTKEVHQAANSSTDALVMPYDNDLQVLNISDVPTAICNGTITPVVKVRNNGNNDVSTFHIKYQVNDGPVGDFTWNGTITTLQKATVTLPEITFTPLPVNTLKVYSVSPNSVNDQYPKNDTSIFTITSAASASKALYLLILTDNMPTETTWDVRSSSGAVIKSGGPYTIVNHLYRDTVRVTNPDCYRFTMYDAGGNGICCVNGSGQYFLADSADANLIIAQGGEFGSSDFADFKLVGVGIESHDMTTGISVYPNPFTGNTTVSFYLGSQTNVKFMVTNPAGQVVRSENKGMLSAGKHDVMLDASSLAPGVYVLQIQTGSDVMTRKITIR